MSPRSHLLITSVVFELFFVLSGQGTGVNLVVVKVLLITPTTKILIRKE